MSLHASFSKRLFAFVIDLTIIIALTALLYLFPFEQIIDKPIDENYKENVDTVVNKVTATYSGSSSVFGTSTEGLFTTLKSDYSSDTLSSTQLDFYKSRSDATYSRYIAMLTQNLVAESTSEYDSTKECKDQFYSKIYDLCNYASNIYSVLSSYKSNLYEDSDSVIVYSEATEMNYTSEQLSLLEQEYTQKLDDEYQSVVKALLGALNNYKDANSGFDIEATIAYQSVLQECKKIDESMPFDSTSLTILTNYFNRYYKFCSFFLSSSLNAKMNDKAYTIIKYNLSTDETHDLLNVYEKYSEHSAWTVIYSLSMFTLLFSIYTIAMRGNTLGRKALKIRLVDGAERDKLPVIKALVHDVLFRIVYLLVIGAMDIRYLLIVGFVFTLVDFIMVRFSKSHKTLRDILSGTRVIELV